MLKLIKIIAIALVSVFSFTQTFAQTPINTNASGVFLDGYDVVSYFSLEQNAVGAEQPAAVKGNKAITAEYNGAVWAFSSEENREMFLKSPETYAPQYDGHCAFGVAKGGALVRDRHPLDAAG